MDREHRRHGGKRQAVGEGGDSGFKSAVATLLDSRPEGAVTSHMPETAAFRTKDFALSVSPAWGAYVVEAVVIRYVSLAPDIYSYRYRGEPSRFAWGASKRPLLQRDVRMGNPACAL